LQLVVLPYNNHKENSLETLCECLRSEYGIEISKGWIKGLLLMPQNFYFRQYVNLWRFSMPLLKNACLPGFLLQGKIKDSTEFKGSTGNAGEYPRIDGPGTESSFQQRFGLTSYRLLSILTFRAMHLNPSQSEIP
jgi:hypothetical protein